MSKRVIEISDKMRVLDVRGLSPPSRQPKAHPLLWTKDGRKRPSFFRWSWNPVTGDLLVGDVHRHIQQIPKDYPLPFESWLRGFLFTKENLFAVRSYNWPQELYDEYDRELDEEVCSVIVPKLLEVIPKAKVELHIGNCWLLDKFSHYSTSW